MSTTTPLSAKLIVSNLHPQATPQQVDQVFSAYGAVQAVEILADNTQCATVTMDGVASADVAIAALHGRYTMCQLPVVVVYDRTTPNISPFGMAHGQSVKASLEATLAPPPEPKKLNPSAQPFKPK